MAKTGGKEKNCCCLKLFLTLNAIELISLLFEANNNNSNNNQ